jgi:hypothetical protein
MSKPSHARRADHSSLTEGTPRESAFFLFVFFVAENPI